MQFPPERRRPPLPVIIGLVAVCGFLLAIAISMANAKNGVAAQSVKRNEPVRRTGPLSNDEALMLEKIKLRDELDFQRRRIEEWKKDHPGETDPYPGIGN